MAEIIALSFPFFGLIFLGFLAAKWRSIAIDGLAWMNFFIIYVALPALFFQLLSRTPIEEISNWRFIVATTFGTYLAFAAAFVVGTISSRGDVGESTIQGLAGAYGNIGYMGPGIAIASFGPEAVVPIALILFFDNTMHFVMAPLLMAFSGNDEKPLGPMVWSILVKVFTHPFILATIVAFIAAYAEFRPPEAVNTLLNYLYGAAAPCALFAMGVSIALRPLKKVPVELTAIVPIKLALHPFIVYFLLSWLGDFNEVWVFTAVLMAALPTATNVFVIAQQYDVYVERASSSILLSTVVSVFTVTGLLYLMKAGILPPDLYPAVTK